MSERPANVRPGRLGDRAHNSHRHAWHSDDGSDRAHPGMHRMHHHRATKDHDRCARAGHHHGGRRRDEG